MPINQARSIASLARGSEWRKWDLHVHSPLSGLNNRFPRLGNSQPNWEAYLQKLEQLTDVAAIGITDYFSIEGYRKIREFRRQGRLKKIALVVPNIELRLSTFTGDQRVNYHVVFSDEVSEDEIENHFLGQLHFVYESSPDDPSYSWIISRVNLETLGARLKSQQPSFQGSDYEVGCKNATVTLEKVKQLLVDKGSIFKGRYLLVAENTSSIPWEGQDHHTRKLLLQGAHAIFSSNANTARWAKGEGDLSAENFVTEFKSLKPCIHGSDAHELDKICNPDQGRFCWIKADTSFEGLKQILYEPGERVFIGQNPPNLKNEYQIIESVQISSPAWFLSETIPTNRDLVAIIGGRGSGKSALAEMIAFAGGSKAFNPDEDIKDSFLFKASKRSATNPNPIVGGTVTLTWGDAAASKVPIPLTLQHGQSEEKVKYLPQKFVERLCAPENNQQLEEEIERVIFQRIDKTEKLDASDFRQLREAATKSLRLKKTQARKDILTLNQSIFDVHSRIELRTSKAKDLALRKAELETLKKQAPQVPSADEEEVKRREELSKAKQELEGMIIEQNELLTNIGTIETKLEIVKGEIGTFNSEIAELLETVGLKVEEANFMVTLPARATKILSHRREEVNQAIKTLRDGPPEAPSTSSLKTVDAQLQELNQKSQLTQTKKGQYEKFQKDRQQLEDAIASLEREIKDIEESAVPRLSREIQGRLQRYCNYFDLLREEESLLEKLYEPLQRALADSNETARKLAFVSRVTCNIARQAVTGYDLVDRRKVLRDERSLETALQEFASAIEEGGYSHASIESGLENLRRAFLSSPGTTDVTDSLRKEKTLKDFDDWLYGTEEFLVSYSMRYDGKDLQLLSPGEKGIVLLLLYLEAEQEDNRPLIIDQPDDNLDNLSVYPSLVEYFRNRKKTRQVIIITHNPNLVVNTDAEQIIVANFDGSRAPRIEYRSGAIEDTDASRSTPGIREDVCKILEGGTEAFQRRERKYSLPGT
jgi:ABC-type cobalamin/Fe3+-siderophores transport system ATPase subunit